MAIDGIESPHLACTMGVLQGSILGPILFSLCINNLPLACKNTHIQMYTDVAVIIASSKTTQETAHILRTELTNIHEGHACFQI